MKPFSQKTLSNALSFYRLRVEPSPWHKCRPLSGYTLKRLYRKWLLENNPLALKFIRNLFCLSWWGGVEVLRVFCYLHSSGNYEDEKVTWKWPWNKKTTVFFNKEIVRGREREGWREEEREREREERKGKSLRKGDIRNIWTNCSSWILLGSLFWQTVKKYSWVNHEYLNSDLNLLRIWTY